jgi:quercetin dioxygenase-like cupin family protein
LIGGAPGGCSRAYWRMALPHAQPVQPIDVKPLGSALPGARSTALFKTDELEVMHLVLYAGKPVPPHKVPGEITVQCIEGIIEFTADGRVCTLHAGQLLYLPRGVVHSLVGVSDASALVTIVLRK